MPARTGPTAGYIARWRPSSVSPEAAAFARQVVPQAAPDGQERAKNLLWAAGKLADYGIGLGLEPLPEVLLHPSVTERFTRCAPPRTGPAEIGGYLALADAQPTMERRMRAAGRRARPLRRRRTGTQRRCRAPRAGRRGSGRRPRPGRPARPPAPAAPGWAERPRA